MSRISHSVQDERERLLLSQVANVEEEGHARYP